MKKTLLVLLALLLGLLGCAAIPLSHDQCNATKFPTAHELELCIKGVQDYEQEQHELEDKRLIARDELIIFLNGCDADPRLVIFEKRWGGRSKLPNERQQRKALKEYGVKYTHDNVHPRAKSWDFQCWRRSDVRELLRQLSY